MISIRGIVVSWYYKEGDKGVQIEVAQNIDIDYLKGGMTMSHHTKKEQSVNKMEPPLRAPAREKREKTGEIGVKTAGWSLVMGESEKDLPIYRVIGIPESLFFVAIDVEAKTVFVVQK